MRPPGGQEAHCYCWPLSYPYGRWELLIRQASATYAISQCELQENHIIEMIIETWLISRDLGYVVPLNCYANGTS